jgi:hypothetical protein
VTISRDTRLILAAQMLRAFAYGLFGLVLWRWFSHLPSPDEGEFEQPTVVA